MANHDQYAVRPGGAAHGNLPPEELVLGFSRATEKIRQAVEKLSRTNLPVLIHGECGTGKEVLARIIHRRHPGEGLPLLKIASQEFRFSALNALPPATGGGRFESPEGRESIEFIPCVGSLCFEDVAELRTSAQWKLMQKLQGDPPLAVRMAGRNDAGFRVICLTSRKLERDVEEGRFRRDLYYRINAVNLCLPPLRERREDIAPLVRYYWLAYSREFDCRACEPSDELIRFFQERRWPGNIRELANVMKRYVLLGSQEEVVKELLESEKLYSVFPSSSQGVSMKDIAREAVRKLERRLIMEALKDHQWNRKQAARALNISYRALLYKTKIAGLSRKKIQTGGPRLVLRSKRVLAEPAKEGAI